MALRRMVPVNFFRDPDITALSNRDMQLILLGLILAADDEGREVAHAGLLGRGMDYPPEQIEAALTELVENDLIVLYQVGRHRYYQLTRWDQWQTLGNKKTPSKYPAPPEMSAEQASELTGNSQKNAGSSQENPENSGESSSQLNLTESNLAEGEEKHISEPLPPEEQPENVLPFPTRADGDKVKMASELAKILRVPVTSALARLLIEFADVPDITLLGEANAARAWVDDQRRNGKKTQMSLPFFRRWLQRSRTITAEQQTTTAAAGTNQATGTTGQSGPPRLPSLMHLGDELRQRRSEQS